jgi:hypothetical protein
MPKRISIAEHLNISELEQLYKQAKDGIESRKARRLGCFPRQTLRQYQIIWLLAQGKKTEEVGEITGYSRTWIYALVKRYNELGISGLCDCLRQSYHRATDFTGARLSCRPPRGLSTGFGRLSWCANRRKNSSHRLSNSSRRQISN